MQFVTTATIVIYSYSGTKITARSYPIFLLWDQDYSLVQMDTPSVVPEEIPDVPFLP